MNKAIFIGFPIAILLLGVVAMSIASRAYADDSAQTQGWNMAHFDFLHNRAYSDSCDPNNGDAFCAAYKIGYYAGWNAANAIYGGRLLINDPGFHGRCFKYEQDFFSTYRIQNSRHISVRRCLDWRALSNNNSTRGYVLDCSPS